MVHVVAWVRITSFLKLNNILCIYLILFIHSSVDRHFYCFYFLALVSDAANNMDIQILVQELVFSSLGPAQKWNCWIVW